MGMNAQLFFVGLNSISAAISHFSARLLASLAEFPGFVRMDLSQSQNNSTSPLSVAE